MTVIIVMPSDESEVVCDLCNAEISNKEGGTYPAALFLLLKPNFIILSIFDKLYKVSYNAFV